jgi:hypothetical protein
MRRVLTLLLLAACSTSRPSGSPAARWEIDEDQSVAVALCPRCGEPVARDGTRCGGCGGAYRIEPTTIDCPECRDGTATPTCEACEGTGKCAICEGTGTFEGAVCPECEGRSACPDCAGAAKPHRCENCGGTGRIELK